MTAAAAAAASLVHLAASSRRKIDNKRTRRDATRREDRSDARNRATRRKKGKRHDAIRHDTARTRGGERGRRGAMRVYSGPRLWGGNENAQGKGKRGPPPGSRSSRVCKQRLSRRLLGRRGAVGAGPVKNRASCVRTLVWFPAAWRLKGRGLGEASRLGYALAPRPAHAVAPALIITVQGSSAVRDGGDGRARGQAACRCATLHLRTRDDAR